MGTQHSPITESRGCFRLTLTHRADIIDQLVRFISENHSGGDKQKLADLVQKEFGLVKDRSVYYCDEFAIRFLKAQSLRFSNTVLSLSNLRKFDNLPFIVCVVSPRRNYLLLANTTFLKKISHSSHELRANNIRGSFNGSDIFLDYEGIENSPENFGYLFDVHSQFSFDENLLRLVESTSGIIGRERRAGFSNEELATLRGSVQRAIDFFASVNCGELERDLNQRVSNVLEEIIVASSIENVNLRGRIVEYLITSPLEESEQMRSALLHQASRPDIYTANDLGDYARDFDEFVTKTDIKTKMMFLGSNPKGYNVDKLLAFLSQPGSVYLLYVVGVSANETVTTRLCSVFSERLIQGTRVLAHWAGRNSRGVTQFNGDILSELAISNRVDIDARSARRFLESLIAG